MAMDDGPGMFDRLIAAAAHLSTLVGLPIVVPALIYIWQRDKPFVADHARQALVCHTMILASVLTVFMALALVDNFDVACAMIAGLIAIVLAELVLTVVATRRASEGRPYRYPLIGRAVRWL